MRTLWNILWHFPFFGFLSALFTFLLWLLLVVTVIWAPIGFWLIELSKFLLTPFSKSMINQEDIKISSNELWKTYGIIVRIVYFPLGLFLAIITIFQIAFLFISIVGIPVALVLAKSLSTYFNPVNKICVPKAVADEIERRKASDQIDKYL
ncbi:MAG: hypothetical protein ACD_49C00064G0028 [uncultured bacterium (gcode 4)]|uniref:Uncharacterized protein n=1 Tax=uncultured bacterium (gcode 4) TaxID=1234023 RepID=K2ADL6_9BACT|nr:MAG: hypothetical protein ACD_49C00064G0028 [uncultured bacterium (gcode 4)]